VHCTLHCVDGFSGFGGTPAAAPAPGGGAPGFGGFGGAPGFGGGAGFGAPAADAGVASGMGMGMGGDGGGGGGAGFSLGTASTGKRRIAKTGSKFKRNRSGNAGN
jgi:hypothetical protein